MVASSFCQDRKSAIKGKHSDVFVINTKYGVVNVLNVFLRSQSGDSPAIKIDLRSRRGFRKKGDFRNRSDNIVIFL